MASCGCATSCWRRIRARPTPCGGTWPTTTPRSRISTTKSAGVLGELDERGWADNTIVIFSSDQGLAVGGRHGLMGKQNLYEHVKSPLVVAGPGIPHGKSDALVYLFDLFPTICDLAGARTPAVVEGKSLLPILQGRKIKQRDWLLCAYRDCQRMVRDDRWKLILYNASGVRNTQLFDLAADPDELHNLADDRRFVAERARTGAPAGSGSSRMHDPVDFDRAATGPECARGVGQIDSGRLRRLEWARPSANSAWTEPPECGTHALSCTPSTWPRVGRLARCVCSHDSQRDECGRCRRGQAAQHPVHLFRRSRLAGDQRLRRAAQAARHAEHRSHRPRGDAVRSLPGAQFDLRSEPGHRS